LPNELAAVRLLFLAINFAYTGRCRRFRHLQIVGVSKLNANIKQAARAIFLLIPARLLHHHQGVYAE
jgi:hypothetical protein